MTKLSTIAFISLASAGGYYIGKQLFQFRYAAQGSDVGNIPFINTANSPRLIFNTAYYRINEAMRVRREKEIAQDFEDIAFKYRSGDTGSNQKILQQRLDKLVQELVNLGYTVNIPDAQIRTVATYSDAARKDLADFLGCKDVPEQGTWDKDFSIVAASAHKIIIKNTKKGIFPRNSAFRVAMMTSLLGTDSIIAQLYYLCYIIRYTNPTLSYGWGLMLKIYKLKYAIEKDISEADIDIDDFLLSLALGACVPEDELKQAARDGDISDDYKAQHIPCGYVYLDNEGEAIPNSRDRVENSKAGTTLSQEDNIEIPNVAEAVAPDGNIEMPSGPIMMPDMDEDELEEDFEIPEVPMIDETELDDNENLDSLPIDDFTEDTD